MTKKWLREHKTDPYYRRAKAEGYRSRAVYKLLEINKKFHILHRGDMILDLGAAPGGWSQVAADFVGPHGMVLGIDLVQIKGMGLENVKFMIGDITDIGLSEKIRDQTGITEVNAIISDASPNISGNYSIDQARSIYLAENVLRLAGEMLAPGGNLVVKVFEGEDFQIFLGNVREMFKKCRNFSPQASRTRSSEIYVIGIEHRK